MGGRLGGDAFQSRAVILIDTSAWIEFLRDTGSPVCDLVNELLSEETAVCDAVRMEVLAGARDEFHLANLRRLLSRSVLLPTRATDYDDAAVLYRRCRRQGETVRKLIDCLIASVAIRSEAAVLHSDADFDVLERHTELQIYRAER